MNPRRRRRARLVLIGLCAALIVAVTVALVLIVSAEPTTECATAPQSPPAACHTER